MAEEDEEKVKKMIIGVVSPHHMEKQAQSNKTAKKIVDAFNTGNVFPLFDTFKEESFVANIETSPLRLPVTLDLPRITINKSEIPKFAATDGYLVGMGRISHKSTFPFDTVASFDGMQRVCALMLHKAGISGVEKFAELVIPGVGGMMGELQYAMQANDFTLQYGEGGEQFGFPHQDLRILYSMFAGVTRENVKAAVFFLKDKNTVFVHESTLLGHTIKQLPSEKFTFQYASNPNEYPFTQKEGQYLCISREMANILIDNIVEGAKNIKQACCSAASNYKLSIGRMVFTEGNDDKSYPFEMKVRISALYQQQENSSKLVTPIVQDSVGVWEHPITSHGHIINQPSLVVDKVNSVDDRAADDDDDFPQEDAFSPASSSSSSSSSKGMQDDN